LTLSTSKSIHKSISLISLYTSHIIATPKHLEPLLPRIMFMSSPSRLICRESPFCGVIESLYYSSTIELLLLLIPVNRFYLSSTGLLQCQKPSGAFWLMWSADSCKIAMPVGTSHRVNQWKCWCSWNFLNNHVSVFSNPPATSRSSPHPVDTI
jgi:hypothetical protein